MTTKVSTAWSVTCEKCGARSFCKSKREADQLAKGHDRDMHPVEARNEQ